MALDLNSFAAAMKTKYNWGEIANMVYKDAPLLALLPKKEDFGGDSLKMPLIYANPQNRSASFTQANSTDTSLSTTAFFLKRAKDYSLANIDGETMEASKGDANAFMDATTAQIDGALNSLARSLAIKLYRQGFGEVGTVAGAVTGTTLTLSNPNDIVNFEVGEGIVFSQTVGASVLRSATVLTVTGVNRSAGTMSVSGDLSTITGLAVGDTIFKAGDRQNTASPAPIVVVGLEGWLSATAPTSTLFFGVDRTVDVTRLGGLRLDVTTMPIEEALIEGASLVAREGGKITHYFMSYSTFSALEKALGTKVQYVDVKMTAEIAFRGIQVNGPRGPINIIPDQNCQSNRIWGLDIKSWKLCSIGKVVKILQDDGNKILRQAGADGYQVRAGYYAQLGCNAPGHNINLFSTNTTIG